MQIGFLKKTKEAIQMSWNWYSDAPPQELFTVKELEEWEHSGKGTFETFDDEEKAKKAMHERHGYFYTQIDSDDGKRVYYERGWRYVNRTGVWAVLVPIKEKELGDFCNGKIKQITNEDATVNNKI
jgi:hypothetical protein